MPDELKPAMDVWNEAHRVFWEFESFGVGTENPVAAVIEADRLAVAEKVQKMVVDVAKNPPHEFLPMRNPSEAIGADEDLRHEGFRDAQRIIVAAIRALDLSDLLKEIGDDRD